MEPKQHDSIHMHHFMGGAVSSRGRQNVIKNYLTQLMLFVNIRFTLSNVTINSAMLETIAGSVDKAEIETGVI